jgi:hypothetical protein
MKHITALTVQEGQLLLVHEKTINDGLRGFIEVGNALLEIRDKKLYRVQYKTFKEYCQNKWHMTTSRAYQLCDAAEVVESVKKSTDVDKIKSEFQMRPLQGLPKQKRKKALKSALEEAAKKSRPLTTKDVAKAAAKIQDERKEITMATLGRSSAYFSNPVVKESKTTELGRSLGQVNFDAYGGWNSTWSELLAAEQKCLERAARAVVDVARG